jgi:hypothetical protein
MAYFAVSLTSTDPEGLDGGLPSVPVPGSGIGQGCAINAGLLPHANTPAPWAMPWIPGGNVPDWNPDKMNWSEINSRMTGIGGTPGVYPNDRYRPEIVALQYQYITYKKVSFPFPNGKPEKISIKPKRRTLLDRPRLCEEFYPHAFSCADDATDFTSATDACTTCNPGITISRESGQKPNKGTRHDWPFLPGTVTHFTCFDSNGKANTSAICGECCDDSSGFPVLVPKCICRSK